MHILKINVYNVSVDGKQYSILKLENPKFFDKATCRFKEIVLDGTDYNKYIIATPKVFLRPPLYDHRSKNFIMDESREMITTTEEYIFYEASPLLIECFLEMTLTISGIRYDLDLKYVVKNTISIDVLKKMCLRWKLHSEINLEKIKGDPVALDKEKRKIKHCVQVMLSLIHI